jgi:hypothetical protein
VVVEMEGALLVGQGDRVPLGHRVAARRTGDCRWTGTG